VLKVKMFQYFMCIVDGSISAFLITGCISTGSNLKCLTIESVFLYKLERRNC
jgi:hypothetical protein